MKILFWLSILFILYSYFGYPCLLKIISLFKTRPVAKGKIIPFVTFIITAYNEERRIKEKIENTLKQDYPEERLEIIIASDCSTDSTDEIVRSYYTHGLKLVRAPERRGKENAQRYAVEAASGEIIVFSDVATILDPAGITNIIKNFNDPTVGCVSSMDRFIDPDGRISGEGAYVKYEMFLRSLESQVNTLVGLSGSFFAARKDLCHPWPIDLQSDFNILLNSVKKGLRGVLDRESIGCYKNITDKKREYERKIRTVLRGISVFMKNLSLLNPFKYGLFSWQLLSHKLCRWFVPFAMILTFISNLFLISQSYLYRILLILQLIFYTIAFGRSIRERLPSSSLIKIPFYLVMANLSILIAWYRYLRGDRSRTWQPSER